MTHEALVEEATVDCYNESEQATGRRFLQGMARPSILLWREYKARLRG